MQRGRIEQIFISISGQRPKENLTRSPMDPVASVMAIANMGLVGDRYFMDHLIGSYSHTSRVDDTYRQATFMALEAIAAGSGEMKSPILPERTRRNIITSGIRYANSKNSILRVFYPEHSDQFADFKVFEECLPCDIPDPEKSGFKKAFSKNGDQDEWRGGVRVEVLQSGLVAVGMSVLLLS